MAALECDCQGRDASAWTTLTAALPLVASGLKALDRFSPAFAGVLTFQIRIVGGVIVLTVLFALSIWLSRATHRARGMVADDVTHYSYRQTTRRLASVGAVAVAVLLAIAVTDLRFLGNHAGLYQVRVDGPGGVAAPDVSVDLLDLDRRPLTRVATKTDSEGVALLDVLPNRGRAAFVATDGGGCASAARLPTFVDTLLMSDVSVSNSAFAPVAVRTDCPAQGAATVKREEPVLPGTIVLSDAPWHVELVVHPRYEAATTARLRTTVVAPPGLWVLESPAGNGSAPAPAIIRPPTATFPRPTNLTLRFDALGHHPVTRVVGPLEFVPTEKTVTSRADVTVDFRAVSTPYVGNIVSIAKHDLSAPAFEVVLSNPSNRSYLVTRLEIETSPKFPVFCHDIGAPPLDVQLTIRGESARGEARRENERFSYPINGRFKPCGTQLQATGDINQPLPANGPAFFRFTVFGEPRLYGAAVTWRFRFALDRDLVIEGSY